MINPKANPLLVQIEQGIRAKIAPEQKTNVDKIVAAGLKILDGEQTHKLIVSQLQAKADPSEIAGSGVAKLLGILMNQSKGVMPMKAGIPAATLLLLEALDRLEALGKIQINNQTVEAAMHSFASSLMQLLGVDDKKLAQITKGRLGNVQGNAQPAPQPPAQPAPQAAKPAAQPLIGAPA